MKTILEILTLSAAYLEEGGIQNARRQAEELLADALGLKRVDLYLEFERPLTEAEMAICRSRLLRRRKGEPLQYIQGDVFFHDCQIRVNPNVLIPRQETEILVSNIIKELQSQSLEEKILWDVCCGSGCIGISLKKRFPQLRVILSDLSQEALELAKQNAELNEVDVEIRHGDLLQPFADERCHFFVCNPPYIPSANFHALDKEVRDFEPIMALIGGPTGLEFYKRLANELSTCLFPSGKVWLEIGHGQGNSINEIFNAGKWKKKRIENDWAGLERFFSLEIE